MVVCIAKCCAKNYAKKVGKMSGNEGKEPELCNECGKPLVFDEDEGDWYCPECDTEEEDGEESPGTDPPSDNPILEDELKDYCYDAFDNDVDVAKVTQELQSLGVYKDEDLKYPNHPTQIARKVSAHWRHYKELHPEKFPAPPPPPVPMQPPAPANANPPAQTPAPQPQQTGPSIISTREFMTLMNKPKSLKFFEQYQEYAKAGNTEAAQFALEMAMRSGENELAAQQQEFLAGKVAKTNPDAKDKSSILFDKWMEKKINEDDSAILDKFLKVQDKFAERMGGRGGDNPEIETLKIIADEVKGTRRDLVDTVREVTGSGGRFSRNRKDKEMRYSCPKCGNAVKKTDAECSECGVKFDGVAQDGSEETFDKELPKKPRLSAEEKIKAAQSGKYPEIPKAVAAQLDNLYRLANWIDAKHDPMQKARFLWGVANAYEHKAALFSATILGKEKMLKLTEPYRRHPDVRAAIPDIDDIWELVTSLDGSTWLDTFLGEVKALADKDNVTLSPDEKLHFAQQLQPAIEYRARMLGKQPKAPVISPNATIKCAVCGRPIPVAKYKEHLKLEMAGAKPPQPQQLPKTPPPTPPTPPPQEPPAEPPKENEETKEDE